MTMILVSIKGNIMVMLGLTGLLFFTAEASDGGYDDHVMSSIRGVVDSPTLGVLELRVAAATKI